jgi:hypothetical protein
VNALLQRMANEAARLGTAPGSLSSDDVIRTLDGSE